MRWNRVENVENAEWGMGDLSILAVEIRRTWRRGFWTGEAIAWAIFPLSMEPRLLRTGGVYGIMLDVRARN